MRQPPAAMPALITPFDDAGEIDLHAHRANVATMTEAGVEGFLIGGSTGEGPYLEPGERARLVAAARDEAPEAFLLCGLAAESLRAALQGAAEATEGGADAMLAVTPTTLVRHRPDAVDHFYASLAEEAALPLLLYSVPKVTAWELPTESVVALASHAAVVGMKDSGGDPVRAGEIARATPEAFRLYTGSSPVVGSCVAAGAHGAITASANYAFGLVADAVAARVEGSDPQLRLGEVAAAVERHGVPGVKAAADEVGLRAGRPRRPLEEVSDTVRAEIRQTLLAADLV